MKHRAVVTPPNSEELALRELLHDCRPDWSQEGLKAVLRKLSQVGVRKVSDLRARLRAGDLNEHLTRVGVRRFATKTLEQLRASAERWPATGVERVELHIARGREVHATGGKELHLPGGRELHAIGGREELRLEVRCQPEAEALPNHASPALTLLEKVTETECAICYEPVWQVAELPCACKVDYCMQCWDRALSQSFQKCNIARCPTCRSPVRVDFSLSEDRLVFSRETEHLEEGERSRAAAEADYFERTLMRISDQVRPAQIRILRDYGAAHRAPVQGATDFAKHRAIKEAWSTDCNTIFPGTMDEDRLCAEVERCVAEGMQGPTCVCGGLLQRVPAKKRAMLESLQDWGLQESLSEVGRILSHVLRGEHDGATGIVCDLCEEEVPAASSVWMCENGDRTIKHATEYDICDACFASCVS